MEVAPQLVPLQGSRHGGTGQRPHRIRRHTGLRVRVAHVIQEDAPLSLVFAHSCRQPVGVLLGHHVGQVVGEGAGRVEGGRAVERDDDVRALRTGRHNERREPYVV